MPQPPLGTGPAVAAAAAAATTEGNTVDWITCTGLPTLVAPITCTGVVVAIMETGVLKRLEICASTLLARFKAIFWTLPTESGCRIWVIGEC